MIKNIIILKSLHLTIKNILKTYEIKLTSQKLKDKKYSLLKNNKSEFDLLSSKINNRICNTTKNK